MGVFARADALDGVLEVRSAYVNVDNGVFLLHARIEYPDNPAIRDALRDGITLTFELDTRVERERRFWFDAEVVALTLRRELAYHAVSERYVVRDVRSGDQQSYPTLEEALKQLGTVDGWPILVEPQLDGGMYQVSVRAGVRRGTVASVAARAHVLDRRLAPHERVVLMVAPGVNCAGIWWKRWSGVALVVLWGAIGVGRAAAAREERAELGRVRPPAAVDPAAQSHRRDRAQHRCWRASSCSSCATIAITCRARGSRRAPWRSSARWSSRRCSSSICSRSSS